LETERLKKEHQKRAARLEQQHFLFLTKKLSEHLPIEMPTFGTVDYLTKGWSNARKTNTGPTLDTAEAKSISNGVKKLPPKISEALLQWCIAKTEGYKGVKVTDFGKESWGDGMALAALVHSLRPDLLQFDLLNSDSRITNFRVTFDAVQQMGVPTPTDVDNILNLEQTSLIAYLSEIYKAFQNNFQVVQ